MHDSRETVGYIGRQKMVHLQPSKALAVRQQGCQWQIHVTISDMQELHAMRPIVCGVHALHI